MSVVSPLKADSDPAVQEGNPFEGFFRDPLYLEFKNHLYNYLRRKEEIRSLLKDAKGLILEIGSGVSPIAEIGTGVIYSDASEEAMRYMSQKEGAEKVMAMSATDLSLKDETVSLIICSEVIEHIKDDEKALREMTRVLKPGGRLILTVPAHAYYFSYDDVFVKHERRYEIRPLVQRLEALGFDDFQLSKVAGLIEKAGMILAVLIFKMVSRFRRKSPQPSPIGHRILRTALPIYKGANWLYSKLVKWEAKIIPFSLAAIVLICCEKSTRKVSP